MLSGLLSLYKGREPKIQDALGRNPKLHFFFKPILKYFFSIIILILDFLIHFMNLKNLN